MPLTLISEDRVLNPKNCGVQPGRRYFFFQNSIFCLYFCVSTLCPTTLQHDVPHEVPKAFSLLVITIVKEVGGPHAGAGQSLLAGELVLVEQ